MCAVPAPNETFRRSVSVVNDASKVAAPPGIQADRVRRAFGSVQAVVDASVNVPPGKVTALIGPNGAGKTTLMLMLAGLLAPDDGTISVAGLDPTTGDPQARVAVGWMPDALGSWDSLSCHELLVTMGRACGMTKEAAARRGFQLLEEVHLAEFAASPLRVLSRGQKQRLSLARTLIADPAVLILDEPASGLDPRSRIDLRKQLRQLAADGKAVLISSHVLSELDEMVDDAIFMSKGKTLDEASQDIVKAARAAYLVTALDGTALAKALDAAKRDWKAADIADRGGDATVAVKDKKDAAALLTKLIKGGVQVTSFAPVGSALEQAYMSMDSMSEDRR